MKQRWILACILEAEDLVNRLTELLIFAVKLNKMLGVLWWHPNPSRRFFTHLGCQEELKKNWTFQAPGFDGDFAVELRYIYIYV